MSFADIVIHVEEEARCAARLGLATRLAVEHDARLIGMHVSVPWLQPQLVGSGVADFVPSTGFVDLWDEEVERLRGQVAGIGDFFRRSCGREGVACEWRAVEAQDPDAEIALHSRYGDLTVIGPLREDGDGWRVQPERVAMLSGRPVLIVPETTGTTRIGKQVLVCWDGGREAARAVADAMPFLKTAELVRVLTVDTGRDDDRTLPDDLAAHLCRHGAEVKSERAPLGNQEISDVIATRARDMGADLVVMGLYGHSRLQELVLGGVSRTLLRSPPAALLAAH